MEIMDKRLNDKGKNWRHVFKTLTLLDYLLHAGSENVVIYFRDNIYVVKTLREFQYIDESGKDQGANVRQKAKDITNLLQDEVRLREERRGRSNMRDRMSGGGAPGPQSEFEDDEGRRRRRAEDERRQNRRNNEDEELRRAIEESKRMAKEEQDKIRAEAKSEEELQRALQLSREEEEKRIKELEAKTQNALFDDDWNMISNAPNQYAQQPQQTGWGDPNMMYMQQQYTSYNPYFFQQQQMQAEQEAEYQRQLQMQAAAQQYQQMMSQQQQQIQHPLQPQPTAFGSNNPFAFTQQHQPQQQAPIQQLPQQAAPQSSVPVADLLGGTETDATPQAPQQSQQQQQQPRVKISNDPRHAELNRLLASGEGIDTFGNFGDMRLGHSAARSTVASQPTGATQMNGQPTGSNPFFRT